MGCTWLCISMRRIKSWLSLDIAGHEASPVLFRVGLCFYFITANADNAISRKCIKQNTKSMFRAIHTL